ncbi:4-(cytidine 5'-diphospho)-2-C-methyl-D-erythritol kinase [Sphingorhabdus lutea]|uniref:4-diphosphocytidyl-2-C-methyl-D-erythritol kinase n=1 Tax=Sphingorhabdus lutea TaxID=1913578 RepID=A0A1L3JBX2_9SPHN|nr:4-(cytidine 5'-diphospho)-2-C-methyl-D-erythritol kinase [Sphingorhabdus lutea]APG62630.1 4-(cytidine 5'-diphospho)-2-C-methyl-D-erythritol kinase [Sphingorhabdus lutea]
MIEIFAPAKINLALHVRAKRDDGYHELDTIFAFANIGDKISGQLSSKLSMEVHGPFGPELMQITSTEDNLIMRAARKLREKYNISLGADIILEKALPIGAGIGGGSADAAAAIKLLVKIWNIDAKDTDLLDVGASLGADIPICLKGQACRATGIGDIFHDVDISGLHEIHILLVNPLIHLATQHVFANWDGKDAGALIYGSAYENAQRGCNNLTPAAIKLCPIINDILNSLNNRDNILTRMSGSGATCFGLYHDFESCDAARIMMEQKFPNMWIRAGKII